METTVDRLLARIAVLKALPTPERRAELRKNVGLSQRELAEMLGVSNATIGHWESGIRTPKIEHLGPYLEALRVLETAP